MSGCAWCGLIGSCGFEDEEGKRMERRKKCLADEAFNFCKLFTRSALRLWLFLEGRGRSDEDAAPW